MRDERERRSAPRRQIEHHVDDRAPGRLVEIAGRLVGDQERGPRHKRAGQRHALLLAARQLRGIVSEAVARDPPARVRPARVRSRRSTPASSSGAATFSCAVMVGIRWKDWNTMPIRAPRNRARASSFRSPSLTPSISTSPLSGRSSPAMIIRKRRFARAGGPDDPDSLAFADCQRDVAQDMHASRAAAETEVDAAHRDRRKDHCESTLKPSRPHMGICAFSSRRWRWRRSWRRLRTRRGAHASSRGAGRQPHGWTWLAAGQGVSRPPRSGAARQGLGRQGHQRRRLRRDGRGRPRALRLVGAAGRRRADHRAWRQRHAARA